MPDPLRISFGLPFLDAIAAAKARKVLLPSDFYGKIPEAARSAAFTVATLSSTTVIKHVMDSLVRAQADGFSFNEWRKFELTKWPATGKQPTDAYLQLIWRNHAQTAYQVGHWRAFVEENNAKMRPFLMYSAVNDSRTRPAHEAMSGWIAPITDQIWQEWAPPCGHNCRCTLISLTPDQAKARGFDKQGAPPAVKADKGWGTHPLQSQQAFEGMLNNAPAKMPTPKAAQVVAEAVAQRIVKAKPVGYTASLKALIGDSTYSTYSRGVDFRIKTGRLDPNFREQHIALHAYLGSQYGTINKGLRGRYTDIRATQAATVAQGITESLETMPVYAKAALHRSVGQGHFSLSEWADYLAAHTHPGNVIQWNGVTSTSKYSHSAFHGPVRFVISSTRGRDVSSIAVHASENEVVIAPKSKMRIDKVERTGGVTYIFVTDVTKTAKVPDFVFSE